MWQRYINGLPLAHPQPGTWPTTQACALTGNRTCHLSVCRAVLSPPSHTSQGKTQVFFMVELISFPLNGVALWSQKPGKSSPTWSFTTSARSPGFTGVRDFMKEEALSLPPTCYSLAGDNSQLREGMEITQAPARPPGCAKEGFPGQGAPDVEHSEAERWDRNSTVQGVWRSGFHPWLCCPHPV